MAKYHRILGKVSKLSVFSVLFVSLIYVIWYTLVPLLFRWPRTFSLNCIVNQSFNKNIQEILEKSPCIVCGYGKRPYFCTRFRERKRRSSRSFEKKLAGKFGWNAVKCLPLHPLSEKGGGQNLKEFYDKPYMNDTETVQGSSLIYDICIGEVPRETVNT